MDICLGRNFFGRGQYGEGSFMLDLDLHFNNDIVLITCFASFDIIFDLIRCYTILGHIKQDRLARLARDDL